MKFVLTIPPSINRTYGVTRSGKIPFYKKKVVRNWEWIAGWEVKSQRVDKTMYLNEVKMDIKFYYQRQADIDNGLKVLLDLFQKQMIYKNDKQVKKLNVEVFQDLINPRVEVIIESYEYF